jgi:hypothetical protein
MQVDIRNFIEETLSFYKTPFDDKVIKIAQKAVLSYLEKEKLSPAGYPEILRRILSSPGNTEMALLKKEELFVLWDAFGCDDENLRPIYTELEAIYLMFGRAWLNKNGWDIRVESTVSGSDLEIFYRLFHTAKSLGHRPVEVF